MTTIKSICEKLKQNQIGCFPCDTIWGIIGAMTPEAAQKIQRLKQRDPSKGFIVLIPDSSFLNELTLPLSKEIHSLLSDYWPGPLTVILLQKETISDSISGSTNSIAIRLLGKV